MLRRITIVAAIAALSMGCSGGEKWTAEAAHFAVYATQIPLYPGSTIEDMLGSESSDDELESTSEGMTWWYTVSAPKDRVAAWYQAKLDGAKRTVDEDGSVVFTMPVPGGEAGEEMGVIVEQGRFRVFEHTRPGKHKES